MTLSTCRMNRSSVSWRSREDPYGKQTTQDDQAHEEQTARMSEVVLMGKMSHKFPFDFHEVPLRGKVKSRGDFRQQRSVEGSKLFRALCLSFGYYSPWFFKEYRSEEH